MKLPPRPQQVSEESQQSNDTPDFAKYIHCWKQQEHPQLTTVSGKRAFVGRVLPAFDFYGTNVKDPGFSLSWVPYRADEDTGGKHKQFNHWFFPLDIHFMYGPNRRTLISPRSHKLLGTASDRSETLDPIDRINFFLNTNQEWADRYGHFRKAPLGESPVCPQPSRVNVFNVWGTIEGKDEEPRNYLMFLRPTGFKNLLEALDDYRKPSDEPRDPNWPDYEWGDITDPRAGAMVKSSMMKMENNRSANTIVPTKEVDLIRLTKPAMENRINFLDIENTLHISTPEEILEMIIEDNVVPYDLIQAACGSVMNVPEAPTKKYGSAGAHETAKAKEHEPFDFNSVGDQPKGTTPPQMEEATQTKTDDDDEIPFDFSGPSSAQSKTEPKESVKPDEDAKKDYTSMVDGLKESPLVDQFFGKGQ